MKKTRKFILKNEKKMILQPNNKIFIDELVNAVNMNDKKYGLKLKELQEKGVIKDFESYFVEQMLKQVKDTFTSGDEDSTMSQYKDLYMDQAIEMVADEVVDQVGENLTQQLYEQMRRNLNITTTE